MQIGVTEIKPTLKARTFASRTTCPALAGSPSTDQSLQKSFHLSHADKFELKKTCNPSKNKKYSNA